MSSETTTAAAALYGCRDPERARRLLEDAPPELWARVERVLLVVDQDAWGPAWTALEAQAARHAGRPIELVRHAGARGAGAEQKKALYRALAAGAAAVALAPLDAPAPLACLPPLLDALQRTQGDAVRGSRFLEPRGSRGEGVGLARLAGNRALAALGGALSGTAASDLRSGVLVVRTAALNDVAWEQLSGGAAFQQELCAALSERRRRLIEHPVPAGPTQPSWTRALAEAAAQARVEARVFVSRRRNVLAFPGPALLPDSAAPSVTLAPSQRGAGAAAPESPAGARTAASTAPRRRALPVVAPVGDADVSDESGARAPDRAGPRSAR